MVKVGKLSLILDESISEGIHMDSAVPTYMDVALNETPYKFTVENNGTVDADYQIYLDNKGTITNLSRFNYALKKDGKMISMNSLSKLNDSMLFSGVVQSEESSSYELYIWLDASTTSRQMSNFANKTYESSIRIESSQQKEMSLASMMMQKMTNASASGEDHYATSGSETPYIWYSGKLWRALSYNDKGEVKAVTATPQTVLPWGSSVNFAESNVNTWLNDTSSSGFLGNLYRYEDFLVTDYPWNYSETTYENFWTSIGNDTIVNGPVGILNTWDLAKSHGDNHSFNSDSFMLQMGSYYLGNPIVVNGDRSLLVASEAIISGDFAHVPSELYSNVSPAVVFKNGVKVISGSGEKNDPYRLEGDQRKTGSLLSTAVSGEYVAFGDQVNYKYRISSVKDQKVQLVTNTALLIPTIEEDEEYFDIAQSSSGVLSYSTNGDHTIYNSTSTEYPAAYFLNHAFLNPLNGYVTKGDLAMIEKDQIWELTTLAAGQDHYKNASKTTSVATVGLLKAGDLLVIPKRYINKETFMESSLSNLDMILLTNHNGLIAGGEEQYQTPASINDSSSAFYPSFYLKDDVKIKSGSGTFYDPYILKEN